MRTKKTFINLIVSVLLTIGVAIIGLFKVKVFLAYLGDETVGLYQLYTQFFSYISIVESGLTSSLLYYLYKPVSEKNYSKINSLLKGGRKFYNFVVFLMIIIGIVLSFNIDFFLSNDVVTNFSYIQFCFIIFLISSSLNYLVTARKVIIEAKQNLYKVHICIYGLMIFKGIAEIVVVLFGFNLFELMLVSLIISIVQNVIIYIISNKEYPQLSYDVQEDMSFVKETKNLFVQKIGNLLFNNIDIILISKFISTSSVVIYTSYNYIINSLQTTIKKIGSSSLASVGNLLVTESTKVKKVFSEYNSLCFYIGIVICIPLSLVIDDFIKLFYGAEYVLNGFGGLLFSVLLFLRVIEIPLDVWTSTLGYFGKIKNCILFQSIINLILSLVLIFVFGVPGVVFATIISYLVGEFIMYPKILNKNYFKDDKINYYEQSFKLLIIGIFNFLILNIISIRLIPINLFEWLVYGVLFFLVNFVITTIYFKLIGQLDFFERIKVIFKGRLIKNEKK